MGRFVRDTHLLGHKCILPAETPGLPRLPPNAPLIKKIVRWYRRCILPNPNLAISKRNFRNRSQINMEAKRHASSKFFYVIHPYSNMALFREIMFVCVTLWEFLITPPLAGFFWVANWRPHLLKEKPMDFSIVSRVTSCFQLIWMVSCFFAAYKEHKEKALVQLDQRYLSTFFIVDLVAIFIPVDKYSPNGTLKWLNMIVSFRCPTVISFIKRFLEDFKLPGEVITCLILVFASFFFTHFFACIFYLMPMLNYSEKESKLWVLETALQPNRTVGIIYMGVFTLVQQHFWGIGEANIRIKNNMEELVLIVVMIVGRMWSLFVIVTMLRVFAISSLSESKYEQYLMQLQTFLMHNDLPKEMEERLLEYYEYKYQRHFFNERAIVSALSHYLKEELTLFRARNVIKKVHLFRFFPKSMIASIIGKCRVLVFMNHDYVIKRGDPIENVYLIGSGTLAVYDEDRSELIHLTDGDEVGIRAVTNYGTPQFDYTYIAIETTEIYVISVKDFREIVFSKTDVLRFFQKIVHDRAMLWQRIEGMANTTGTDLLSDLHNDRILEGARVRTRYVDR